MGGRCTKPETDADGGVGGVVGPGGKRAESSGAAARHSRGWRSGRRSGVSLEPPRVASRVRGRTERPRRRVVRPGRRRRCVFIVQEPRRRLLRVVLVDARRLSRSPGAVLVRRGRRTRILGGAGTDRARGGPSGESRAARGA